MRSSHRRRQTKSPLRIAALAERGGLARALVATTLLIALAVGPIGAVTHAWEHLAESAAQQHKSPQSDSVVCMVCAAYAALEQATPALPLVLVRLPVEPLDQDLATPALAPTPFFHYRQRAPPTAPA